MLRFFNVIGFSNHARCAFFYSIVNVRFGWDRGLLSALPPQWA